MEKFTSPYDRQQERIARLNKELQDVIIPEVRQWEISTAYEFVNQVQALSESFDMEFGDAWKVVSHNAQVKLNFWQRRILKQDRDSLYEAGAFDRNLEHTRGH